jgi:hypothetical protein
VKQISFLGRIKTLDMRKNESRDFRPEEYNHFCDNCKIMTNNDAFSVEMYWKDESKDSEYLEFCTLKCVREWLLKFLYNKEEVHFVTLPYISNVDDLYPFLNGMITADIKNEFEEGKM